MNNQKIKRVLINLKSGETQVINGNFVDTITLEYEPNNEDTTKRPGQLIFNNECLIIKNRVVD